MPLVDCDHLNMVDAAHPAWLTVHEKLAIAASTSTGTDII